MNPLEALYEMAPHGHPRFNELCIDEMEMHSAKNKDYAGGGDPLGNFKRRSIIIGLYPGLDLSKPEVVALLDILKQLDAALWLTCQGKQGEVETVDRRLMDVAVYAKLSRILAEERR